MRGKTQGLKNARAKWLACDPVTVATRVRIPTEALFVQNKLIAVQKARCKIFKSAAILHWLSRARLWDCAEDS